MKKIYLSEKANSILCSYLTSLGYEIKYISTKDVVADPVSSHPDMFMCKLGVSDSSPIYYGQNSKLGPTYPNDIIYNCCGTGKFFIHNLKYTCPQLRLMADSLGMIPINVNQGYTKCSTVIVDEYSIITYDKGIAQECEKYSSKGLETLLVSPGNIVLDGYNTGFIGGCSGRVDKQIIFNGNLELHPDFHKIKDFIESRNLQCVWFPEYPLTDIGSIISTGEEELK